MLRNYSLSLLNALKFAYPEHPWADTTREWHSQRQPKSQSFLFLRVSQIFPKEDLFASFMWPMKEESVEIDVAVPALKLALEYQGEQHYLRYLHGPLERQKERDRSKQRICEDNGVTLIEVPFWWDRTSRNLLASIVEKRPDLRNHPSTSKDPSLLDGVPIARIIPEWSVEKRSTIFPGKPAIEFWDSKRDPTGWFICPQFQGIQVVWDGNRFFEILSGTQIRPSLEFAQVLPKYPLEGVLTSESDIKISQLWETISSRSSEWKNVVFMVQDRAEGSVPFERRLKKLSTEKFDTKFVRVLKSLVCEGKKHLTEMLEDCRTNAVLLRRSESLFTDQHSLFVHQKHSERMAVVVQPEDGAFQCKLSNGALVNAISNEKELWRAGQAVLLRKEPHADWKILSALPHLDWDSIYEQRCDFEMRKGKKFGRVRCLRCKKHIPADEFRIRARAIIEEQQEIPRWISLHFHFNLECVAEGIHNFSVRKNSTKSLPLFQGTAGYDNTIHSLSEAVMEQLSSQNIELVKMFLH
eukprot:TRINITY_DN2333_c0_g1_i1.p1 TRINITY_DN2333_c0_g1~~TRINITY_DN2333_c0_g1_i1.p1  ORF type:complete len:524 (-),score=84.41 TRINITY_DN2333_c0_g1_i1:89-1660(-)